MLVACIYKDVGRRLIRSYPEESFCCSLPGGYNLIETLKPLMESKVLKLAHKGKKKALCRRPRKTQKEDGMTLAEE